MDSFAVPELPEPRNSFILNFLRTLCGFVPVEYQRMLQEYQLL